MAGDYYEQRKVARSDERVINRIIKSGVWKRR
jgi:hypothetical protein